mmetsp:Transcript_23952/g.50468  ORF Transcript_23952/g.50468 Transcript_23952/m.50468 type:complete len:358 (-) Transcript_23952:350-1423(-)
MTLRRRLFRHPRHHRHYRRRCHSHPSPRMSPRPVASFWHCSPKPIREARRFGAGIPSDRPFRDRIFSCGERVAVTTDWMHRDGSGAGGRVRPSPWFSGCRSLWDRERWNRQNFREGRTCPGNRLLLRNVLGNDGLFVVPVESIFVRPWEGDGWRGRSCWGGACLGRSHCFFGGCLSLLPLCRFRHYKLLSSFCWNGCSSINVLPLPMIAKGSNCIATVAFDNAMLHCEKFPCCCDENERMLQRQSSVSLDRCRNSAGRNRRNKKMFAPRDHRPPRCTSDLQRHSFRFAMEMPLPRMRQFQRLTIYLANENFGSVPILQRRHHHEHRCGQQYSHRGGGRSVLLQQTLTTPRCCNVAIP